MQHPSLSCCRGSKNIKRQEQTLDTLYLNLINKNVHIYTKARPTKSPMQTLNMLKCKICLYSYHLPNSFASRGLFDFCSAGDIYDHCTTRRLGQMDYTIVLLLCFCLETWPHCGHTCPSWRLWVFWGAICSWHTDIEEARLYEEHSSTKQHTADYVKYDKRWRLFFF